MARKSLRCAGFAVPLFLASGCVLFGSREDLWGPVFDVAVEANRAYVCAGKSLLVLDVEDPRAPALAGQVAFPDVAVRVDLAGGRAYVAISKPGRRAIDVSDPARPVEVNVPPPAAFPERARGQFSVSPYTYINENCEFFVVTGVDPQEVARTQTFPRNKMVGRWVLDPGHGVRGRNALFVALPYVYVVFEPHSYTYEFCTIDVSNPVNPRVVGHCPIGAGVHEHPSTIVVARGIAYVGASLGGLVIVDVSDPRRPAVAARFRTSTQI